MDNRLQEAVEIAKEIEIVNGGMSKTLKYEALQTLISYAEQGLKLEGVMQKKKEIGDGFEHTCYNSDEIGCSACEKIGENRAIDDYTHALIQKLDVEKIDKMLLEAGISGDTTRRCLALSIKEYMEKL